MLYIVHILVCTLLHIKELKSYHATQIHGLYYFLSIFNLIITMDQQLNGWFTERSPMWPGQAFSLQVR